MISITQEFLNERPLSYSSLKEFAKSPRHYIKYLTDPFEQTPSMLLGSIVHMKFLAPKEFGLKYKVAPEVDKRTVEGKAKFKAFEESLTDGAVAITAQQDMISDAIVDQLMKKPDAVKLLNMSSHLEHSAVYTDPSTGLPIRYIIDGGSLISDNKFLFDLKTCQSSDPRDLTTDFFNRKYYLQAGLYSLATGINSFYFIAVETSHPYSVSVVKASDDFIKYGKNEATRLIDSFKECMDLSMFNSGYEFFTGSAISELDLPKWIKLD